MLFVINHVNMFYFILIADLKQHFFGMLFVINHVNMFDFILIVDLKQHFFWYAICY